MIHVVDLPYNVSVPNWTDTANAISNASARFETWWSNGQWYEDAVNTHIAMLQMAIDELNSMRPSTVPGPGGDRFVDPNPNRVYSFNPATESYRPPVVYDSFIDPIIEPPDENMVPSDQSGTGSSVEPAPETGHVDSQEKEQNEGASSELSESSDTINSDEESDESYPQSSVDNSQDPHDQPAGNGKRRKKV